ncbi:MAG TPA: DUF2845 domain-containing protein [Gammaproteobacteria bacterium]|nr:DUF2845 domain-containing protein [Gammaproteobacteria bacterium]
MILRYSIALLAFLLASAPARADAMRCGSKLVTDGDSAAKVLNRCGEPEQIVETLVYRTFRPLHFQGTHAFPVGIETTVGILVEKWTYNFGPLKLMRVLHFENGYLVEVETLGYGYHD